MRVEDLPIASPCHAEWDRMDGSARRRFCGQCAKHVHDLSALREEEARALIDRHAVVQSEDEGAEGAGICVRYAADRSGRVLHRRSRLVMAAALGASLVSLPSVASTAARTTDQPSVLEVLQELVQEALNLVAEPPILMGEIVAPVRNQEPTIEPTEQDVITMGALAVPAPEMRFTMGRPVRLPIHRPTESVSSDSEEEADEGSARQPNPVLGSTPAFGGDHPAVLDEDM